VIPFPLPPEKSLFALQITYLPSKLNERGGEAQFKLFGLDEKGLPDYGKQVADGRALIGKELSVGEYILTAKEVRYWVAMSVRYEPGKPIVLTSLWVALTGMIITTAGRMLKKSRRG
jgi:hypothetical protein